MPEEMGLKLKYVTGLRILTKKELVGRLLRCQKIHYRSQKRVRIQ